MSYFFSQNEKCWICIVITLLFQMFTALQAYSSFNTSCSRNQVISLKFKRGHFGGVVISSYKIVLSGEDGIIQGETVEFKAEVFNEDGTPTGSEEFKFKWSDNATPEHSSEFISKSPGVWKIIYNSSFPKDSYSVSVKAYKSFLIWTTIGSVTKTFEVSKFVKGDLVLSQGNFTRQKYVSDAEPVQHEVVVRKSHLDFLNKTKNFFRTYWFVDCIYYGQSDDYKFSFNYTKVDSAHYVEALLVAAYIPQLSKLQGVMPNSSKTSLLNVTTLGTNVTISNQTNIGNSSTANTTIIDDYIDQSFKDWLKLHQTVETIPTNCGFCINSSAIPMVFNYSYGIFRRNFTVKAPVKISPINGTNWLMDGEVLNINVSCNGSSPYSFCVLLKPGLYNVTGKETCMETKSIKNCSFGIQHLFTKPTEYTLVVIISNAVSHVVKPIAVNIYKVKKHAQLSVIIVPVSFSLIATILIIFGVAYYVQSKRKYTIEVADFDFGNQTSSMEYKSFTERLRESISNSLLKSHDYQDNDDSWPESASNSRKYGSME